MAGCGTPIIRIASPIRIFIGIYSWLGVTVKEETVLKSLLQIAQDTLGSNHVNGRGFVHELRHVVYSKGDIWSCKSDVLQCTNNAAKRGSFRERSTLMK